MHRESGMESLCNSTEDIRELLSAEDVRKVTGLSRASAYALLNRSDLPVVKIGCRKFMHKGLFLEWLKEQAVACVQK